MLLKSERVQVAAYGRKMIDSGLTKGTGGNISVYNREQQLIAISPSGLAYDKVQLEDVVILNLAGEIIEGERKPSSELEMHRIFYQRRSDINAVVHTHSPFASTIAALRWDLPAATYLLAFAGGNVRCSKYATFATRQLAENAFEGMRDRKAVLLANHGLLAGGNDLLQAFNVAEEVEYCAEIYYRAKSIGDPVILPNEEMERLLEKFVGYGETNTKK